MISSISTLFQMGALLCLGALAMASPFVSGAEATGFVARMYVVGTALALLTSLTSDKRGGVDFLISFFFLFFMAVPALVQVSIWTFPWGGNPAYSDVVLAYGACAAGQVVYLLASSMTIRASRGGRPPAGTGIQSRNALFYSKWAIGLGIFAILLAGAAGPSNLFVARTAREGGFGGLTQQFLFISRSISLMSMVILGYLARQAPLASQRRQNLILALLFIPVFLVINYVPALPRFVLFGVLISISCLFVDYSRPRIKVLAAIAAVFVLFAVFPVAKVLANEGSNLGMLYDNIGAKAILPHMLTGDFDGFMQIASTVRYIFEFGDFRWGSNFLGVALFFVPRALWHSKPTPTGEMVAEGLGYWYTNVSSPLPAEAMISFGLIGIFLVFALLGYAVARIEILAGFPGRRVHSMPAFFLYCLLMGFIIIILRGALNAVAPQFASGFLAFAFMQYCKLNRVSWGFGRKRTTLSGLAGPGGGQDPGAGGGPRSAAEST